MRGKRFDFDFVPLVFTAGPWTSPESHQVDPMPLVITDLGSQSIEARVDFLFYGADGVGNGVSTSAEHIIERCDFCGFPCGCVESFSWQRFLASYLELCGYFL